MQGGIPLTVDVVLIGDLANECRIGSTVTVLGIVKTVSTDTKANGKRKRCDPFKLYVEAISVIRKETELVRDVLGIEYLLREANTSQLEGFSRRDLEFIQTFKNECHGAQLRLDD